MQHTEQADVEQAFFGQIEAPTSSIHSRSPFIPPPCANTLPGDEERTGNPLQMARADMVSMGKRADYALSFEGSNKHDGVDTASIARRSAGGWVLHVKGKPAHSMGVFSAQSGYGAIYETARILNAFREQVIEPSAAPMSRMPKTPRRRAPSASPT